MEADQQESSPKPDTPTKILRIILGVILAAVLLVGGLLAYAYAFSPAAIKHPQGTHYHFRLQIISGGTPVNFADAKYQTELGKDTCTVALTKQPIHFHDNLDQFVHIHWDHMTGGILLKNYGWNFIGGPSDTLGYRFDNLPHVTKVPIHGFDLPTPPSGASYYVYTGDQNTYTQRKWSDFITEDLRNFFAGQPVTSGILNLIAPAAYAQSGSTQEQLARLNDVIGSAVIFVQKNPPTAGQIKDRFNHLIPLPESTCSG